MKMLPVSMFQEQFYLLNLMAPESAAYNIPSVLKLDIAPDLNILEQAINEIIGRHDSLRTHFTMENIDLEQVIHESAALKIKEVNIDSTAPENELPAEVLEEVNKAFDLETYPLLRVSLFTYQNSIFLTIVFHHIIVDLHSKGIFSTELSQLYNAIKKDKKKSLPENKNQYPEYSTWHNHWLAQAQAGKMIAKWQAELPKENPPINLPLDFPRPNSLSLKGERIYFTVDREVSVHIHKYATRKSSFSFVILLTSYAIFLNRLSNQSMITIGVPLTNRRNEEYKDTFGCFVNIVPLVIDFPEKYTESEIRKQIRNKLLFAHRKQETPFVSILNSMPSNRNSSYNPYFQTGFTFEPPMNLQLSDISSTPMPCNRNGAQLDIFLTMWENDKQFCGYLEFATDLFKKETVVKLKDIFNDTLVELLCNTNEN